MLAVRSLIQSGLVRVAAACFAAPLLAGGACAVVPGTAAAAGTQS